MRRKLGPKGLFLSMFASVVCIGIALFRIIDRNTATSIVSMGILLSAVAFEFADLVMPLFGKSSIT